MQRRLSQRSHQLTVDGRIYRLEHVGWLDDKEEWRDGGALRGPHRGWDGEVRGAWIDKGDGWTDLRERIINKKIYLLRRLENRPTAILSLCTHAQPRGALESPSGNVHDLKL